MSEISETALAIARGLVYARRATPWRERDGGFIRLFTGDQGLFFVKHDGRTVYLQPRTGEYIEQSSDFLLEFERLGNSAEGRETPLHCRFPTPEEYPDLYDYADCSSRPPGWINPLAAFRPAWIQEFIRRRRPID
jgi:hypothetical protein